MAAASGRLSRDAREWACGFSWRGRGSDLISIPVVTTRPRPLPDDIEALKAALSAERAARQLAEARVSSAEAMIAHLKLMIAKYKRDKFGQSSERARHTRSAGAPARGAGSDGDRGRSGRRAAAAKVAPTTVVKSIESRKKPVRAPLPAHLPRERVVIPAPCSCPSLRRQARQAGRGHHRDARSDPAPMEGDPDRTGEVHLPRLREDHPTAGAVPSDRQRAGRCRACWR